MSVARRISLALVLAVLPVVCWMSCDKGVEPKGEPAQYQFYFKDMDSSFYFSYNPESGVLDSFALPFATGGCRASADGRAVYVSTAGGIEEVTVSTTSRRLIWPHQGMVSPSPDGRLIAVQDGGIHILRLRDLSVVYEDTLALYYGVFSADSRSFYSMNYDLEAGTTTVYRIRISPQIRVDRKLFVGTIVELLPAADERRWYMSGGGYRLMVYDTGATVWAKDTIIEPGSIRIALSPDGRYLFVTNPGSAFGYEGTVDPPYTISVFDAVTLDKVRDISTDGIYGKVPIREIAVSPDSKWLMGLSDAGWIFASVRLDDLSIERFGIIPHRYMVGLTIQSMR